LAIISRVADLASLGVWDLLEVYWHARTDLDAHRAGLYLVDLVYNAITDHDPHPGVYDALAESLSGLGESERLPGLIARFQWRLLREIGSMPDLDAPWPEGAPTVYFHPIDGRMTTGRVPGSWPVRPETITRIREFDAESDAAGDADQADQWAGRFLSEYFSHLFGRDLATRRALFGQSVTRRGMGSES